MAREIIPLFMGWEREEIHILTGNIKSEAPGLKVLVFI